MTSTKMKLGWLQRALKRPWLWMAGLVVVGLVGLFVAGFFAPETPKTAYHEVKRGDFLVTIVEGGTLEAVNEVVVRNEVEGNSRVIYIVPEGTFVKKGDLLVELDTGEAEQQVNQQEIAYEKAKSTYIQAEKDLEIQRSVAQSAIDTTELKVKFAKIDLDKYMKGQRLQELRNAEIEITTATSALLLAKDTLEWSEKLFQQGFETKNAVDQGRNQVQDLTLKLEKAQTNLWVLQTFDHPKMMQKYESDLGEAKKELDRVQAQGASKLVQLQADLITQSNSLDLVQKKLDTDRRQLVNSKIYAPQDGLVVYAVMHSRFSSQSMIEEGAMVRNRQELIKLPDTSDMKVTIQVHESHVSKVRPGQPAFVVLDPLPDQRFKAEVTKVGVLPDTQSMFGNPNLKVYKTEVVIKDKLPDIKPGVSAQAEIVITNIPSTITVPIQAVTSRKGKPVVFRRKGDTTEPVPVEVGLFNTKFIEVLSGLSEGDQVLLSPPFDASEKDLGGAIIGKEDQIPTPTVPAAAPNGEPGPTGEPQRKPQPSGSSDQVSPPNREQPGGPATPGQAPGQSDQRPGGRRAGPDRQEMLKRFDKNGDGELDESERNAMREEMKKRGGEGGRSPQREQRDQGERGKQQEQREP
jgi:HlyD family secretion protein